MHITRTPLTTAAPYDLDAVKLHARVDGDDDDASLALMARAAAREIEAHSELALLRQIITVSFTRTAGPIRLPVGPLDLLALDDHPVTVQTQQADGSLLTWPQGWWIDPARNPVLHLDAVDGDDLVITYPAGFGDTASSIPADLQLAIMDQAARSYDLRGAEDAAQGLSLAASRIAARYRRVAVA